MKKFIIMSSLICLSIQASQKATEKPAEKVTINMHCFDELDDLHSHEFAGIFGQISQVENENTAKLAELQGANKAAERERVQAIIRSCQGHRSTLQAYFNIKFPDQKQ